MLDLRRFTQRTIHARDKTSRCHRMNNWLSLRRHALHFWVTTLHPLQLLLNLPCIWVNRRLGWGEGYDDIFQGVQIHLSQTLRLINRSRLLQFLEFDGQPVTCFLTRLNALIAMIQELTLSVHGPLRATEILLQKEILHLQILCVSNSKNLCMNLLPKVITQQLVRILQSTKLCFKGIDKPLEVSDGLIPIRCLA